MTKISAQVVADSKNEFGDRITTLLITFPRIILSEVNTHRALSKNTSSSRAIPLNKMVESVSNDPFIPIAWQKDHKGMQGIEYLDESLSEAAKREWLHGRDCAVEIAQNLNKGGFVTKQLCNRLLEPYMWTTMLVTGTDDGWNNFFNLRCSQYETPLGIFKSWKQLSLAHSGNDSNNNRYEYFEGIPILERLSKNKGQAEIHMMKLAECVYDAMNESKPKDLLKGEWHIPFEEKIDNQKLDKLMPEIQPASMNWYMELFNKLKLKVSVGMAARTSYTVVGDEKDPDYKALINIHDKCLEMNHSSVFEHCARVMNKNEYVTSIKGRCTLSLFEEDNIISPVRNEGWCRNYRGFIQYRHILEENFS